MKKQIVIALVEASPPFTQQNTRTKPSHADVEVVLISDQNFTLFTPLLHSHLICLSLNR
jgi:hypothetical protein